ncbi:MAG: ATP-binding cassette domain-containing protein [Acetobacteraceae bacterium]|nr:ATP-binding cassette domain-containing protein [Acetobacteraceae bacterium]
MIGGTVAGRARFAETVFRLPRHHADESLVRELALLALHVVGLEDLASVRADRLQHSELRFMEIARALMLKPAFLLLDEPAAGLSTEEILRLGELITEIRAGPRETVRAGLVHVIEGHRVFTQLTVIDNLRLAAYDLPRGERMARVEEALSFFPEIAAKQHDRGGALSGGQQQMLAVAQGLVRRPRLIMLDEPSAGLSPVLVDRVLSVARSLRERGTSVLLVEQLIEKALGVADRVYALARGRIVMAASTSEPDLPHRLEHAYFGQDVPFALH